MGNIYKWPRVSIVIPSFNQGQYIEEALLSVVKQNYANLELIIIDGGSTDNTIDTIKKFDRYITYWVSEQDNGQAHAINKGFQKATGDIIGWINSDDFYLENYIFMVVKAFDDPKIDIVTANSVSLDEQTKDIHLDFGKPVLGRYLVFGGIVPSHTTFWRKGIHQNLDENIHCAMDYELWLRLFRKKKIKVLNIFGGVFRYHSNSKSAQKASAFAEKWQQDYNYILKKHRLAKPSKLFRKEFHYATEIYRLIRKILFKFNQHQSAWRPIKL